MTAKSSPPDHDRIFTVAEASRWFQVREAKSREAIHKGELKAARIGRLFRIRERDLNAFFESRVVADRLEKN